MKPYLSIPLVFAALLPPAIAVDQQSPAAVSLPAHANRMQIRNLEHDQVLRPRNAGRKVGNPIVLYYATSWRCLTWNAVPAGGETVRLENYFTGKSFAAGEDNQVRQVESGEGNRWIFEPLPSGQFRIRLHETDRFLTAGESDAITVETWSDKDSQKWILDKGPDDFSG